MSRPGKILLLGEVVIDVTLGRKHHPTTVRLGGVIHACRTLWALDQAYDIAFIVPSYLFDQVQKYTLPHGAPDLLPLGDVTGAPAVILISHPEEAHSQGYELLLRDEWSVKIAEPTLKKIKDRGYSDVLMFAGHYDIARVYNAIFQTESQFHLDWGNSSLESGSLDNIKAPFDTFIISTSSNFFLKNCQGSPQRLVSTAIPKIAKQVLLKENRGGSRLFTDPDDLIQTHAHIRAIEHSVGVGDSFNSAFIALSHKFDLRIALAYASAIAAEYATTIDPDEFAAGVSRTLAIAGTTIVNLQGVVLPWEDRPNINVYIAGADFDFRDRTQIDRVVEVLKYHNFTPRLPVREHGQVPVNADKRTKDELCARDVQLLQKCDALIAIYEFDDPGTLIEIGVAAGLGIPVIVFDPFDQADNLMVTSLPKAVVNDLDTLLVELFSHFSQ